MPGVSIRTATRSGPVNTPVPETGRYFVAGITARGPANQAVKCRSLAEFEVMFGGRVPTSYLHDDLRVFFEEGGTEAWVSRAVGGAATVGTVTLKDTTDPAAVDSVRVDAIGPGAWSADVALLAGEPTGGGAFLFVSYGPTQEVHKADSVEALVGKVNATSRLVRATHLGGNGTLAQSSPNLSAGDDKVDTVTASTVLNAVTTAFGAELGTGAVALPGYSATVDSGNVYVDLITWAKTTRRVALM
ncbi:MAG: hypothetical protein RR101_15310, partial [Burkholderiaceae bacterium]